MTVIGITIRRVAVIRVSASTRITVWRITIRITSAPDDDRRDREPHDIGLPATSTRRRSPLSAGNRRRRLTWRNAVAGAAEDYAEVHGFAPLLLLARQRLGFVPGVVPDRINDHARFFELTDVVIVIRRIAPPVNAVGEDYKRFAPFHARYIVQREFDRVVKLRSLPRLRRINRLAQFVAVVGELAQVVYSVVERNDLDAVGGLQLFHDGLGRALNSREIFLRARAGVEHQQTRCYASLARNSMRLNEKGTERRRD